MGSVVRVCNACALQERNSTVIALPVGFASEAEIDTDRSGLRPVWRRAKETVSFPLSLVDSLLTHYCITVPWYIHSTVPFWSCLAGVTTSWHPVPVLSIQSRNLYHVLLAIHSQTWACGTTNHLPQYDSSFIIIMWLPSYTRRSVSYVYWQLLYICRLLSRAANVSVFVVRTMLCPFGWRDHCRSLQSVLSVAILCWSINLSLSLYIISTSSIDMYKLLSGANYLHTPLHGTTDLNVAYSCL